MRIAFASEPGHSAKPNEDQVLATSNTVVVLDGLTAPADLGTGCHHGVVWYVNMLGARLVEHIETDLACALTEALRAAITDVAAMHKDTCDLTHDGTPSATVAIVARRVSTVDYLVLADSTIVIETSRGLEIISDPSVENVAADEVKAAHSLPTGSKEHAVNVAKLVAAQRRMRNQPGGYWVAAADPSAADHALSGAIAPGEVKRAAVMTDGAARFVDLFEAGDWSQALEILSGQGPAELLRRVRDLEQADPDGGKWPRYKQSDDATAVLASW